MSYAVLQDRLELRLKSPRLQIDAAELLAHLVKISAGKYVIRCTLESLRLPLCLLGVTSTKASTLLRCRMLRDPTAAAELLPMVGRARLSLIIGRGGSAEAAPAGGTPAATARTGLSGSRKGSMKRQIGATDMFQRYLNVQSQTDH